MGVQVLEYTARMKIGPNVPNSYYRVSVKALITNAEGEILVVNERGTGWGLPGGGLDWGESAKQALQRELQEELGCGADIQDTPVLISPAHADSYNQHVLWIIYRATIDKKDIQKISNVGDVRFMSVGVLKEKEEDYEAGWESPIDFWAELQALIKS